MDILTPRPSTRAGWIGPLVVYLVLVGVLKTLHSLRSVEWIGLHLPSIAMILFLYVPLWFVVRKKTTPDALGFHLRRSAEALRVALATGLIVFVPFVLGFILWQVVTGVGPPKWRLEPIGMSFIMSQFLGAALPEEVFYRGYLQSEFNRVWVPMRTVMGARWGRSLVVTSALFALGHVIIEFSPVRLAVFFPSIVFGWLRERTDGLLAPVLFHGLSNILMAILQSLYA